MERLNTMGRLWDEAADALQRKDYAAFDSAMHEFRKINGSGRVAQEAPPEQFEEDAA